MGISNVQLNLEARAAKFNNDLADAREKLRGLDDRAEQTNENMRNEFGKTSKIVDTVQTRLLALFSIGAIAGFIRKLVDLRIEWEKQTSIIKTVIGSQRESESVMKMIKKMADASSFSINELSDAYIRLANQGIKLTYDQMKKMIDVAVASNKSFIQLTEAIFDATMGQTRGLKDFGITSKTEGDKIQLSFKGMTKEVDLTSEAITDFVVAGGELEGVAGAAEGIEKTLKGAFEGIGDSYEQLMIGLGTATEGLMAKLAKLPKGILDYLNKIYYVPGGLKIAQDKMEEFKKSLEGVNPIVARQMILDYIFKLRDEMPKLDEKVKTLEKETNKLKNSGAETNNMLLDQKNGTMDLKDAYGLMIPMLQSLSEEIYANQFSVQGQTDAIKEQARTINVVQKELEQWRKDIGDLSGKELAEANRKIQELEQELIKLKNLGLEPPKINIDNIISKGINQIVTDAFKPDMNQLQGVGNNLKSYYNKLADEIMNMRLGSEKMTEDEKIAIAQEGVQTAMGLVNVLSQYQQQKMNEELEAAGDNEKKKEDIRRKYAKKEQSIAIGEALIGVAQTVINALQTKPFVPVGLAMSVLAGILGAAQIAAIKSVKFATGTLNLQGRGTGTSDSIPAMLSRGESVMTAKETSEYYPYLKAMKEGVFPRFQLDTLEKLATINNNLNYDNSKEIRELREINKKLTRVMGPEYIYVGGKKIIKYNGLSSHVN